MNHHMKSTFDWFSYSFLAQNCRFLPINAEFWIETNELILMQGMIYTIDGTLSIVAVGDWESMLLNKQIE